VQNEYGRRAEDITHNDPQRLFAAISTKC